MVQSFYFFSISTSCIDSFAVFVNDETLISHILYFIIKNKSIPINIFFITGERVF